MWLFLSLLFALSCPCDALGPTFTYLGGSRELNQWPSVDRPGGVDSQVSFADARVAFAGLGYGPDCSGQIGWLNLAYVCGVKELLNGGNFWKRVASSSCLRNATSSLSGAYPGARSGAAWWPVSDTSHMLFGGFGTGSKTNVFEGKLADLWLFDHISLQWSYVGGPTTIENVGNYGELGVESVTNWPGGRVGSIAWRDTNGTLFIMLGWGLTTVPGRRGGLSDIWRLRFLDNGTFPLWTWVAGPSTLNNVGSDSAISGRYGVTHWSRNGCLYVYGGHGIASDGKEAFLSSMYSFCGVEAGWKLLHGSLEGNVRPIYGNQGSWNITNTPGSRYGAVALPIASNSSILWLFGGSGAFSDVWAFDVETNQWAWMDGPQGVGFLGTDSNWPSGRRDCSLFSIDDSSVILMGGYGYGPANRTLQGGLSDIWRLDL